MYSLTMLCRKHDKCIHVVDDIAFTCRKYVGNRSQNFQSFTDTKGLQNTSASTCFSLMLANVLCIACSGSIEKCLCCPFNVRTALVVMHHGFWYEINGLPALESSNNYVPLHVWEYTHELSYFGLGRNADSCGRTVHSSGELVDPFTHDR